MKATAPGDEIRDLEKLRAAWKPQAEERVESTVSRVQTASEKAAARNNTSSTPSSPARAASRQHARRFHLTPDLTHKIHNGTSSAAVQKQSKRFKSIRPALATFVERYPDSVAGFESTTNARPPVLNDAIHNQNDTHQASKGQNDSTSNGVAPALETLNSAPPFDQQQSPAKKTGTSMHDHPSTWDVESDQLADELAAFALELDPGTNHHDDVQGSHVDDVSMVLDDDYVYETYVRMPYDEIKLDPMVIDSDINIGVLIIDEEVENLWQEYLNEDSDDDDQWDEEDSNAEDNPSNDYPEDEVDDDDEHGYNAYGYRNGGSDNEQYDEEYDD